MAAGGTFLGVLATDEHAANLTFGRDEPVQCCDVGAWDCAWVSVGSLRQFPLHGSLCIIAFLLLQGEVPKAEGGLLR